MTDNSLRFRNHDFAATLTNLRNFLSNQDQISDYDVNQSVFDILLSAMAWNTQNTTLTGNVLFAEQNIDTATLRKNIVKESKSFGYVPYSATSAKSMINVVVVPPSVADAPSMLILDKGTVFQGESEKGTVSFTNVKSYSAPLLDGRYEFRNVELYQGVYGSTDIFIDKNRRTQIYEIPVDDIDMNYLEVYVQKSADSSEFTEFNSAKTSIKVTGEDKVYFYYEIDRGRYGIEFGDGKIGKAVQDQTIVRVVYFKTLGPDGNGVKSFTFKSSPNTTNKLNSYSVSTLTISKSAGGLEPEPDESVVRNAPRFFVSQNRGVNPSDYSDNLKQKFPFINSISTWSGVKGEGLYDQLGRIYISANTEKSQFLTEAQKDEIVDYVINSMGMGGIAPVIVDTDNIYIDISTKVFVDNYVFITASDIKNLVTEYAMQFDRKNLNNFESIFEFSPFTSGIDKLHSSISSNITSILIHKRVTPDVRVSTSFSSSFMNPVKNVYTNNFTFAGKTVFIKSQPDGTLNIYEIVDGKDILVKPGVGFANMRTGEITVREIVIDRVNPQTRDVRFYAEPLIQNIKSSKNNVVTISSIDTSVDRLDSEN
ncbi:baseplate wedge subunit [Agrobacterium phage Atu_ph04]|uniref:Baseplate wedge subunit n=1 Tax=Agrobacterium phage Atu_ph04 TaxID=2024263 RepID=A0A223W0Q6_9CAUD|nr:baseplate wedge subunit [Agrobacterium phage Atu_ph04]ASV44638.2 baseplate wedge subunit [Agrobacterium phage Atu_ph04]